MSVADKLVSGARLGKESGHMLIELGDGILVFFRFCACRWRLFLLSQAGGGDERKRFEDDCVKAGKDASATLKSKLC